MTSWHIFIKKIFTWDQLNFISNLLLWVEVESHLREPFEGLVGLDLLANESACDGTTVNVFVNLKSCS